MSLRVAILALALAPITACVMVPEFRALEREVVELKRGSGGGAPSGARLAEGLGAPEAIPHLVQLLKDRHENVRANSAGALARLGATRAIDAIEPLLGDPEDKVRRAARKALDRLGK